jgi:hypothetical protein
MCHGLQILGFSQAGFPAKQGEAAFHYQVLNPKLESAHFRRLPQRVDWDIRQKRIVLEPEQGQEFFSVHYHPLRFP